VPFGVYRVLDACEPNQKPSFLEHLANGGVSWNLGRLYCAPWQKPNATFRMTHKQQASLRVA
jgi:hypothetical protein